MNENDKIEIIDIISETKNLLDTNNWKNRFSAYANTLYSNKNVLENACNKFHEWNPLKAYLTIGESLKSNKFIFSLRFLGQEVAKLSVDLNDNISIDTIDENNAKLGITTTAHGDWSSSEARKFRKDVANNQNLYARIKEHTYESEILTEMTKKNKTQFKGMKPIQICKARFPMATPIKASDKGVFFEGSEGSGGGIDIFTRTRGCLNVLELKKEYKYGPLRAVKQAVKYAVFVEQLLRDPANQKWWELFGFTKSMPQSLTIYATCVMPQNPKGINDTSFAGEKFDIPNTTDKIQLHYIYFEDVNGKIKITDSSFKNIM